MAVAVPTAFRAPPKLQSVVLANPRRRTGSPQRELVIPQLAFDVLVRDFREAFVAVEFRPVIDGKGWSFGKARRNRGTLTRDGLWRKPVLRTA